MAVVVAPAPEGEANGAEIAATDEKDKKPPPEPKCSFMELYQFATPWEWFLLFFGSFSALITGVSQPGMLFAFDNLFGQLGSSEMIAGASVPADALMELLLIMVVIGVCMGVGQFLSVWCNDTVAASMASKYKKAYLKAVLRQDVGWYDVSHPEELSTKFAESMVKVQKGMKRLPMMFLGLGYGTGGLVAAFIPWLGNWEVALVTLGTVPLLIVPASIMMYFVENGSKLMSAAYGQAGGIATECLFSMRTIMSLSIERKFERRYKGALAGVRKKSIINQTALMTTGGMALSAYLIMMAVAIVYGCYRLSWEIESSQFPHITNDGTKDWNYCADSTGALMNVSDVPCTDVGYVPFQFSCHLSATIALAGETPLSQIAAADGSDFKMPPGQENFTYLDMLGFQGVPAFSTFMKANGPSEYLKSNKSYYGCLMTAESIIIAIFAIMMMGEGFSMAGQPLQFLNLARESAAKILAIINRVPTIDSWSEEGVKLDEVKGDIEVKDVSFGYPSAPDTLVTKNLSVSIQAGTTVAFCGPSGSGKSTIIQLLERFYDPLSGQVTLDGHDIKTFNVRWLRSQVGLVSQEPMLFAGTVKENIANGHPGVATQAEIEDAAKQANAHDFILKLSDGYNTQVGQGGSKLSGGQKQRVAIARAIIKKPKILLLDEATSALDTKSEKICQKALDDIVANQKRTVIVIAHRLSTIRTANTIYVFQEGVIAEKGSYDELMAISGGVFQGLAAKQEALLKEDQSKTGQQAEEAEDEQEAVEAVVLSVDKKASDKGKTEEKPKEESAPYGRVFKMQSDVAIYMFLMCFFSAAACGITVYGFYLLVVVMEVVYEVNPVRMRERALRIAIELLCYAAGVIGCLGLSGLFNGICGAALTAKLRSQGVSALMRQEMGFFDMEENSSSELAWFLQEKVDKVKIITTEQVDIVAQLIGAVIAFVLVLVFASDWRLLLAWVAVIVIMSIIAPMQAALMVGEDKVEKNANADDAETTSKIATAMKSANHIVGDAVMGIRTVASFNLEQRMFDNFNAQTNTIAYVQKRDAIVGGLLGGLSNLVMMVCMGAVFYLSVYLANQGLCTFEEVMAPMMAVTGLMVPMMKMGALNDLKTAGNAAIRFFSLVDRKPSIDNLDETGSKPARVEGAIEVKDVYFAYPSSPDHLVCKGYSLSIAAGQTVALCGPSGAGKSTIISLIERFYDPKSGSVSLDGCDLKSLNIRWLRSKIGLVGQEPVLFQGSISENVSYGATEGVELTQAEIEEACKMANAHEFITNTLADGYKSDVGLKGQKLSGGQKQRVAIARAIVKKPSVLLLDEATSALDNESERIVQAALDEIMTKQKRTTIVIAHRLSTIRNADKIAVVSEGTIVEEGTHDELLAKQGLYVKLVMSS